MRGVRVAILGVAVLVGLHLFMLAGGAANLHPPGPHCLADKASADLGGMATPAMPAPVMAAPAAGERAAAVSAAPCHQPSWHDMSLTCLAILTGLAVACMALALTRKRRAPELTRLAHWVAPVARPPTPPPIALGISRT